LGWARQRKRSVQAKNVKLEKHNLQIDGIRQLAQGLNLITDIRGAGSLENPHAQNLGVKAEYEAKRGSDGDLKKSLPRSSVSIWRYR